jgi:hypothetical protein
MRSTSPDAARHLLRRGDVREREAREAPAVRVRQHRGDLHAARVAADLGLHGVAGRDAQRAGVGRGEHQRAGLAEQPHQRRREPGGGLGIGGVAGPAEQPGAHRRRGDEIEPEQGQATLADADRRLDHRCREG